MSMTKRGDISAETPPDLSPTVPPIKSADGTCCGSCCRPRPVEADHPVDRVTEQVERLPGKNKS